MTSQSQGVPEHARVETAVQLAINVDNVDISSAGSVESFRPIRHRRLAHHRAIELASCWVLRSRYT